MQGTVSSVEESGGPVVTCAGPVLGQPPVVWYLPVPPSWPEPSARRTVFDVFADADPSRRRGELLAKWERLSAQLAGLAHRPAARPGRFDDSARRRSVLRSQLASLDERLDELCTPVPPLEALVSVLAEHVSGDLLEVVAAPRTVQALRNLPRSLRRRLCLDARLVADRDLPDGELHLVSRSPEPLPEEWEPPDARAVLDGARALARWAHRAGRVVLVPDRALSQEAYEVFSVLCSEGMSRQEASDAAARLVPACARSGGPITVTS